MAAPQDYDLGDDDDMYIVGPMGSRDWAIADSNETDIELILVTSPGSWKQNPAIGMGAQSLQGADIGASDVDAFESGMKVQLLANGFDVNTVKLFAENGNIVDIQIDADRQI